MRERLLTLCMGVGCVVLAAAAFIVNKTQDKIPPTITIEDQEKKITYTDGAGYEELLADVTASDNKDGDVTDQIFIESITPISDGSRAIVRYAVIDKSNNVSVKTRIVNYGGAGAEEQDTATTEEETAVAENEKTEETESADATEELEPDGSNPAIRLKQSSLTIEKGETFDVLSAVDQVVDDQDDTSTLFKRIHVDGEYDTSVPGTYKIRYYVLDTDNNTSNVEEVVLTVQ